MSFALATTAAFVIMVACSFACLWRVAVGPSPADRAGALAFMGILAVGLAAVVAAQHASGVYVHAALAWSLASFVATLAIAKHIEGKALDE